MTENPKNTLTEPIYFLNKSENPFVNLYNQNQMTNYQEEVYKMILNYKYYSKQFAIIDERLYHVLNQKSELIRIIIYVFVNINTFLYLIIGILIYIFLFCFIKIIVRVLNYVVMITNTKYDGFDFKVTFSNKIENLEIILESHKSSPLETEQNLNIIYNEYNQFLINKKNFNKRNSLEEEKDVNDIPKNQQMITIKDINRLDISNKYHIILIILVVIIIIIYACFLFMWIEYFSKREKLFNIITKNAKLEASCYEAVNIYELMAFNNYISDEIY